MHWGGVRDTMFQAFERLGDVVIIRTIIFWQMLQRNMDWGKNE